MESSQVAWFPLVQLPKKFKVIVCGQVNFSVDPKFPLVQLPKKFKVYRSTRCFLRGGRRFPLVQLPKKFKVVVPNRQLPVIVRFHQFNFRRSLKNLRNISWIINNRWFPLVQLPKKFKVQRLQPVRLYFRNVSISSTSEEV